MNLIKFYIVLSISVFYTLSANAQCLYTAGQTIAGNGYTYKCDTDWGGFILHNTDNVWAMTEQKYKDGSRLKGTDVRNGFVCSADAFSQISNAIRSKFTSEQIDLARGEILVMDIFINSNSGKIDGVNFMFNSFKNAWCRIPVDTYRSIEVMLKNTYTFNITDLGKNFNYNKLTVLIKYPKTVLTTGPGGKILPPLK